MKLRQLVLTLALVCMAGCATKTSSRVSTRWHVWGSKDVVHLSNDGTTSHNGTARLMSNRRTFKGSWRQVAPDLLVLVITDGKDPATERTITYKIPLDPKEGRLLKVFSDSETLLYRDTRYGFQFSLPVNWNGFSIFNTEWAGQKSSLAVDAVLTVERGPMIVIRSPDWKTNEQYQDIPILIFTRKQWHAHHDGKFSIGAGGLQYEIAHNAQYVFTISSRFNANDALKGWKEANEIVQNNMVANGPPVYEGP